MDSITDNATRFSWDDFLKKMQSQGRYTFTIDELRSHSGMSNKALLQGLYRKKTKKQIAQIRKGFYAIIPPEYSTLGMLPPYLLIDDLMKSLNKPYYVALFSAAALYGAAHQQPMEFFVITQTPAPRSIHSNKLKISFFSKKAWEENDVIQKATNAGYINVSSPELTALDLLAYSDICGINLAATVLRELAQTMRGKQLFRTANKYPKTSIIQRLGYIFDNVIGEEQLAITLQKALQNRSIVPVLLAAGKEKPGETDLKWQVIVNMKIESDL